MRIRPLYAPPTPTTDITWRTLYTQGRFVQRNLESPSDMRRLASERGLSVPLGKEIWELWDKEGVLRPIAFGLARWGTHDVLDPAEPDTLVLREEHDFQAWEHYAVQHDFSAEPHPLYAPWQLLQLHDALVGRDADLPVDVLLDARRREHVVNQLRVALDGQLGAWRTLDDRWIPTHKLLVAVQNRFWPAVSGRVTLPWDSELGERVDPMAEEVERFDAIAVLDAHDVSEEQLARIYEWLIERGARLEGGEAPFTEGGDRWGRLRQIADRRERRRFRGPPRIALDFYEAAELLGRFWFEMTGRYLPGIDVVPQRRTTKPLDQDTVSDSAYERTREALRMELVRHGLWPGRIHAIVEGNTEEDWVRGLLLALLGYEPDDLLITNIFGTGGAKRIERIIETIADYATYAALIVDREGEMARYVRALVEGEVVDQRDVLMVDTSFEEANFTDAELVRVAKQLAADPPGNRAAVRVRLTARELRAEHNRRRAAATPGRPPGLADTLLKVLKDPTHGPVNLNKTELSAGLLNFVLGELERGVPIDEITAKRPIVRFVTERIANPVINAAWR